MQSHIEDDCSLKVKDDGLHFMSNISSETIPCAFFDPQYRGVMEKLNYGNEGARQVERAGLPQMSNEVITQFIQELNRVLTPSGHLFLWVDKFHLVEGVSPWLEGTSLNLVDLITWDKKTFGMGYRTRRTSEYLIVIQKTPKRAKGVWTNHSIRDVWSESARGHTHAKPEGLQETLIACVTEPGDCVLDPAAGGYSVMRSAIRCGRLFTGCDLL